MHARSIFQRAGGAVFLLAAILTPARSAVPEPSTSRFHLSPSSTPCHHIFRVDGASPLTLDVTVNDAFGSPLDGITIEATLVPAGGTALCSCDPLLASGVSDTAGFVSLSFSRIGGRGTLDVEVTARASFFGWVPMWSGTLDFTSPDLDASCDADVSTDVFDLGIWAQGLPPGYDAAADYVCNGIVDVYDLGILAQGLSLGCSP